MSVEYRIVLLPRDRVLVPSAERVCALVERLRRDRWVLTPEDPDFVATWNEPPARASGAWAEGFVASAPSPRLRWQNALAIPDPLTPAWVTARRDVLAPDAIADELSLQFSVSSGDATFAESRVSYPLAYGADDAGYHTIAVCAARDFVRFEGFGEVLCTCGADLAYEVPTTTLAPIDFSERIRAACIVCTKVVEGSHDAIAGVDGDASRFSVIVDFSDQWPTSRRLGEGPGEATALRAAGFSAPLPLPIQRAAEDDPRSRDYDAEILRSPYGDPAPALAGQFLRLVEETLGDRFEPLPMFY